MKVFMRRGSGQKEIGNIRLNRDGVIEYNVPEGYLEMFQYPTITGKTQRQMMNFIVSNFRASSNVILVEEPEDAIWLK